MCRSAVSCRKRDFHNGMTLVELLIGITIITLLMAISIPLVRYSLEHDRVREGSRQVNMMLANARTRAIERGRPVGVWLQRSSQSPNACTEIYLAESPPPYTGDVNGARVFVIRDSATDTVPNTIAFDARSAGFTSYVFEGDFIRFNGSGDYFIITGPPQSPYVYGPPLPGAMFNFAGRATIAPIVLGSTLPSFSNLSTNPAPNDGLPFEVLRHPKRLNGTPLQLPDGIIVDLRHSGIGAEGTQFMFSTPPPDADHVIISFDASGSMSNLFFFDDVAQYVDGPVHLLIGRLDQLGDADSIPTSPNPIRVSSVNNTNVLYDKNLADQASIWVSVGSRTGAITTAENAWELRPSANWAPPSGPPYFANSIRRAREFAQAADAMGGR